MTLQNGSCQNFEFVQFLLIWVDKTYSKVVTITRNSRCYVGLSSDFFKFCSTSDKTLELNNSFFVRDAFLNLAISLYL